MTCPPNHTGTAMKLAKGGRTLARTVWTSCVSSSTTSRLVSRPWRRASRPGGSTRRRRALPSRVASVSMVRPKGMKRGIFPPRKASEVPRRWKPSLSAR